jgi:NDP-sugar pyrophosphorylase family protein
VSDLLLNLHHRPATITRVVGDGSDLGARVRYSWEHPVLGSAGGPRHALALLTEDRRSFLVVNGDTLTDLAIGDLLAEHARAEAAVTMALVPNPRPDKYGGVTVSADGWVTGFTRRGAAPETFHFVGVQAVEAYVFADLEDGVPAESVGGVYPKLIAGNPRSVRAFVSNASFQDIGTPADYLETSLQVAACEGDRLARGNGTRIARSAVLSRTIVWDDVMIGDGARLTECIVCDGARVPDGAQYERCAVLPPPAVRDGASRVEEAVWVQPLDAR